ncbi:MAG: hypothetical protein WAO98_01355 [Alphaproteobacteria bacterium]
MLNREGYSCSNIRRALSEFDMMLSAGRELCTSSGSPLTLDEASFIVPWPSEAFPFVAGQADVGRDPQKVAAVSQDFLKFGTRPGAPYNDTSLSPYLCGLESHELDPKEIPSALDEVIEAEQNRGKE